PGLHRRCGARWNVALGRTRRGRRHDRWSPHPGRARHRVQPDADRSVLPRRAEGRGHRRRCGDLRPSTDRPRQEPLTFLGEGTPLPRPGDRLRLRSSTSPRPRGGALVTDVAHTRRTSPTSSGLFGALRRALATGTGPVFVVLAALLLTMLVLNPGFYHPASLMAFLRNAAPLIILAIGQYFVIVSGEFDLSVGSLVGAQVVIAARLIDGEESRTWPVIALMLVFGLLVGLVNGLVTTLLRVPSFITTLGMMLVLYGAIRMWTGGAPTGALSESFRQWGRMGIDMPVLRQLPYALLIMIALAVVGILVMRSSYGRLLIATGDNDTAATFAGGRVWLVRTGAF